MPAAKKELHTITIERKPTRGRKKEHWLVTIRQTGVRGALATFEADSQDRAGRYIAGYFKGISNA